MIGLGMETLYTNLHTKSLDTIVLEGYIYIKNMIKWITTFFFIVLWQIYEDQCQTSLQEMFGINILIKIKHAVCSPKCNIY